LESFSYYFKHISFWYKNIMNLFIHQKCTEMVMPIGIGSSSMFQPNPFNFTTFSEKCKKDFGVSPRSHWITSYYGGHVCTPMKLKSKCHRSTYMTSVVRGDPVRSRWDTKIFLTLFSKGCEIERVRLEHGRTHNANGHSHFRAFLMYKKIHNIFISKRYVLEIIWKTLQYYLLYTI